MGCRDERRWVFPDIADAEARALAKDYGLSVPVARILLARGITTPDAIEKFLNPRLAALTDPFLLPDMHKAVEIILGHIESGSTILVYGDYDADGVTATALMIQVLTRMGAMVLPFLPHRIEDGYGLNLETLHRCVSTYHPQLVITVDCGTSSVEAAEEAARLGIDLVITDHHVPNVEGIAQVPALVNPKLGDHEDIKMLAGVGVAFKVCHALIKLARDRGIEAANDIDLRAYLELVALGTVADMVPLLHENRILVHHGLKYLNRTQSTGLLSLIRTAGLSPGDLDTFQIGYVLAPRINAVGRLGSAMSALELILLEGDGARANDLAKQLEDACRRRQEIEDHIYDQAVAEVEKTFDPDRDYSIVLSSSTWHAGVIGIVASRIVSRYNRPTVIMCIGADGIARGSSRSINGFKLLDHVEQCRGLLRHYGGHAMAAGIELDAANIAPFTEKFGTLCAATLQGMDLRRPLSVDAELRPEEITTQLYTDQLRLRPYGHSNSFPVWVVRGAKVHTKPTLARERHVRTTLQIGPRLCDTIGFNMAYRDLPAEGATLDIAFNLTPHRFNPRELQLHLQDFHIRA